MSIDSTSVDLTNQAKELRSRYGELKKEFSELFALKNEMLAHDAPLLTSLYLELIGRKLYEVYCLSVELSKLKQKMTLLQAYVNRNEAPDLKKVEQQIENQFEEYQKRIEQEAQQLAAAREYLNGPFLTDEETKELKGIYYTIVKRLHPDINPDLTDDQKELFYKAQSAYDLLDINTLRVIMVSLDIGTTDSVEGLDLEVTVKKLSENVSNLKQQIDSLKKEFPFVLREKIADDNWVKSEQENADKEAEKYKTDIEKYKQYVTLLEEWKPA
ncbi:MAG: J domain-containing protein [Paludibacteraceae bacterium]